MPETPETTVFVVYKGTLNRRIRFLRVVVQVLMALLGYGQTIQLLRFQRGDMTWIERK